VEITRRTLFESETLHIGVAEARPVSEACGEVERQSSNVMVLPFSGVFSKHDAPGRHVVVTPSHAVFIAADTPYRIGFPGAIGDRALTLRFSESLAPDQLSTRGGGAALASNGLLSANAMILRNLLWARLERRDADEFEVEALGLDLLDMSFRSMRTGDRPHRRPALARRARALERVKEAVALAPGDKWNVAKLAQIANLSPFICAAYFARWLVPPSTITSCRNAWLSRWTRFSTVAMISPRLRSTGDLRVTATSRLASGVSSAVPRWRCGAWQQPGASPNCARS
jgi:hypothetical protein